MNDEINENVVILPPFKHFIMTIGELPTSYLETMTYYEMLVWFINYLGKTVIPAINENGEAVTELQNLFEELQNYVNTYFDNLDVQEEVNNKLDEMASDGTLNEIINQEIFGELNNSISTINSNIGNLADLNTLNKDSIVKAINSKNTGRELKLGISITYDIPDNDVDHSQGSCQYGNYLYVAVQGDQTIYPTGFIYVFNIINNSYITRYTVPYLYHGNDLTYYDGKIYIAQVDNVAITEFNIATAQSTYLDPFSSYTGFNEVAGVTTYNNKIMCWLTKLSTATITLDKMVLYDTDTGTNIEYTILDPYIICTFTSEVTRQSFTIYENNVYILMQSPNVIYHGIIDDEARTITLINFYDIPVFDKFNNAIGETEGISCVYNNEYPEGLLMLTSREMITYENQANQYGKDTIRAFFINPLTNVVNYPRSALGYYQRIVNTHFNNSVSASSTSLLEIGNSSNPFKNIIRGINSCSTDNNGGELYIRDSGTYYIPFLFGKNVKIIVENTNQPVIYLGIIKKSNLTFETNGSNSKITIKSLLDNNYINLHNSNIEFRAGSNNIEFNNVQFRLYETNLKTRRCIYNNTVASSSGYDISLDDNSVYIDGINTWTSSTTNKIQYGGNSIVYTPLTSNVIKNGVGACITMS